MPALRTHSLCWSGCWTEQRPCPDTFSFLACLKISPVPFHLGLAVHLPVDDSFPWHWSDGHAGPRPFVGLQKQLRVRVACGITSHLCHGRVHCLNDFDQASSFPPSCFEGELLSQMHGGIWKGMRVQINKCQHRVSPVCVCVSADRNPYVPSANKGYFPWSWAITKASFQPWDAPEICVLITENPEITDPLNSTNILHRMI